MDSTLQQGNCFNSYDAAWELSGPQEMMAGIDMQKFKRNKALFNISVTLNNFARQIWNVRNSLSQLFYGGEGGTMSLPATEAGAFLPEHCSGVSIPVFSSCVAAALCWL